MVIFEKLPAGGPAKLTCQPFPSVEGSGLVHEKEL